MTSQHPAVTNEAVRLYEFGVEEELHRKGTVALDSSLGVLPDPGPRPPREDGQQH